MQTLLMQCSMDGNALMVKRALWVILNPLTLA
jgi:hypothetical protein